MNVNLIPSDVATILFQATFKVVVKVCQVFNGEYTGVVVDSETPQLHQGDLITFGKRIML